MAGHSRPATPSPSGPVEHTGQSATPPPEHEGHNTGRLSSWLAVVIMVAGFVIGGLGLVLGPTWLLFWIGVGVIGVGGIYALASGIMEDYG